ncbi:cytochrome P450, putative [Metarhizium acridum CQMa 102]|uniref:Cytochrome P450, putative n=1 Tax=Metarhizium acridum (strain CQMa 102) TaxID=655827 RepID=E9EAQ1_METAQ|nr:cytochrome P450, putative [Metarhizium acridum CQMa 102]EFY87051.1 cytochrome P450, putative [Metarhizium acridum CQMa 102]
MDIPIVRIPFGVNNYTWVILQPFVWNLLNCLPLPWSSYPDFVRYSHRSWHFLEKSRPNTALGPVWALVSPEEISLHFADPDIIGEIFARWRDFVRPVQKYRMLAIYGPSVFTVGLDDWPRHRKAVVAPFNDDLMSLVWRETLCHTRSMLDAWTTQFRGNIQSLENDLRELTFNVLGAAAFHERGQSQADTGPKDVEKTAEDYLDTLRTVLENSILLMLIPYHRFRGTIIPRHLAKVGRAAESFRSILLKVLSEETAALGSDSSKRNGLLTPLVRALKPDAREQAKNSAAPVSAKVKKSGLSVDEILGNSFVINFAGHDTVLLTLTFTLALLVVHPDVQEWIYREIKMFSGGRPTDEWDYELFLKLKRCQAVLLETLRIFPPITGIPKIASHTAPTLRLGDRILAIPPGTEVFPLLLGVQTDARYWEDPYIWRPSRWIFRDDKGDEELLIPHRGTFFPWSEGPQICVGKKFSQVEGVAVLACLLHEHRLLVQAEAGETQEQARRRVRNCVDDVNYNLLLRMNHPERVRLKCVPIQTIKPCLD